MKKKSLFFRQFIYAPLMLLGLALIVFGSGGAVQAFDTLATELLHQRLSEKVIDVVAAPMPPVSTGASPLQKLWKIDAGLAEQDAFVPSPVDGAAQGSQALLQAPRSISKPETKIHPETPERLVIPSLNLDMPVVFARYLRVEVNDQEFYQWRAPNKAAAGWHYTSARLGQGGNVVMSGHHNVYGEVFRDLSKLKEGDEILVYGDEHIFYYSVTNIMIFPERWQTPETRLENARWMLPTNDDRLTLLTCYPYETNTHRLIVVAKSMDYILNQNPDPNQ